MQDLIKVMLLLCGHIRHALLILGCDYRGMAYVSTCLLPGFHSTFIEVPFHHISASEVIESMGSNIQDAVLNMVSITHLRMKSFPHWGHVTAFPTPSLCYVSRLIFTVANVYVREPRCRWRCSVRVKDLEQKGHRTLRGLTRRIGFMFLDVPSACLHLEPAK